MTPEVYTLAHVIRMQVVCVILGALLGVVMTVGVQELYRGKTPIAGIAAIVLIVFMWCVYVPLLMVWGK